MKNKSRFTLIAVLLITAMILSSCGVIIINGDEPTDTTSVDTTAPVDTTTAEKIDKSPTLEYVDLAKDYLAALSLDDYNGEEIVITGVGAEELGGANAGTIMGLNRGKRNSAVESALNTKLLFTEAAEDIIFEELTLAAEAREKAEKNKDKNKDGETTTAPDETSETEEADLLILPASQLGKYAENGLIMDLSELDIDYANLPYFNYDAMVKTGGGGKIYGAIGDGTCNPDTTFAVFYNKTFAEKLELGDLYTMAANGEFTYDVYKAAVLKALETGVGVEGFTAHGATSDDYATVLYLGGNHTLMGGAFGEAVTVTIPTEEDDAFIESIAEIFAEDKKYADTDAAEKFMKGEMLFYVAPLSSCEFLSTASIDWGVLPIPKQKAEQTSYCCFADFDTPVIAVPAGTDKKKAEDLISAFFAGSYKFLASAYAENQMSYYLRDSQSVDMVYLITQSVTFERSLFYAENTPAVMNAAFRSVRFAVAENKKLSTYAKQYVYTAERSLEFLKPAETEETAETKAN